LSLQNYESVIGSFPVGAALDEGAMWSAFILPYMEQQNIRDLVTIDYNNNVNYAANTDVYTYPVRPQDANLVPCETVVPVYRCPSMGLPEHIADQGSDTNYYIRYRVPGSYIGNASGVAWTTAGSTQQLVQLDGVLTTVRVNPGPITAFSKSKKPVELRQIEDGLSNTVAVGEAFFDIAASESSVDATGYAQEPPIWGNRKDHWYIGSDSIDVGTDVTEALGSTGVPPNLHKQPSRFNCNSNWLGYPCQALQLSFSSEHPGITQVVMCDGSVHSIQESIGSEVWSKMGTRSSEFDRSGPPTQSLP
jgi:hypothetical protein